MKFTMTAECQPKNAATWFDGFQDGGEFEAETPDAAQDWLNSQCAKAGTSSDAHYGDFGPIAAQVDVYLMNPHTGSVDTLEGWEAEGFTQEDAELIEVTKAANGDWIEA